MSLVLVIDTAGDDVFLLLGNESGVISKNKWESTKDTGIQVLNNLAVMLNNEGYKKSDLSRIGVFAGPGRRFSALRSGITLANVLSYALQIELVGLNSGGYDENVFVEVMSAKSVEQVGPKYAETD